MRDAAVLDQAAGLLGRDETASVRWNEAPACFVYQHCLRYAELAHGLAQRTNRVDAETAWACGLLAPLGWLAVCGVDASAIADCLTEPGFADNPTAVQMQRWGIDQASIARRVARRWGLPPWLGAVVGHLALPVETAQNLGAEPTLFRLVQLAVLLAQRSEPRLGLRVGARLADAATAHGLSPTDLDALQTADTEASVAEVEPAKEPLLRDLLMIAAENRRLAEAPILERLESDVDCLHQALETQRGGESARLQTNKLGTLAEFAAGAGHEINNPLAVISGQAQYLLGHEVEPNRQRALQTIIGQAQRIHDLLTELMLFARPPRPQKRPLDLGGLIREVTVSLGDLAAQRQVRLVCPELEHPITLHADGRQIRTALTCLLRNAIEAAPVDGWAGVRVATPAAGRLELIVEDSGAGPAPQQREHMFDPFYSGRQAGRGRGLGLPTAWRLAREHGGDVYFDELSTGPTRFVLALPHDTNWLGHAEAG
jgi:signal transduction histidine kinase